MLDGILSETSDFGGTLALLSAENVKRAVENEFLGNIMNDFESTLHYIFVRGSATIISSVC